MLLMIDKTDFIMAIVTQVSDALFYMYLTQQPLNFQIKYVCPKDFTRILFLIRPKRLNTKKSHFEKIKQFSW